MPGYHDIDLRNWLSRLPPALREHAEAPARGQLASIDDLTDLSARREADA